MMLLCLLSMNLLERFTACRLETTSNRPKHLLLLASKEKIYLQNWFYFHFSMASYYKIFICLWFTETKNHKETSGALHNS